MKRLNVKLLIGLIAGSIIAVGGAFVIHRFQIRGTSEQLLAEGQRLHTEAEKLKEDPTKKKEAYKQLKDSAEMLAFHLQMNPENVAAADEQALIYHEMIPLASDTTELFQAVQYAGSVGETVITNYPQETHKQLRQKLADLYMSQFYGRFSDAARHLKVLLKTDENNTALQLQLARCTANQPEQETAAESLKQLEAVLKADPKQIDAYILRAAVLRDRERDLAGASDTMDAMVAANQESYRAYLARANFNLQDPDKQELVKSDLAQALEKAPKQIDVIMTAIKVLSKEDLPPPEQVTKLRETVEEALKDNDSDERLYSAIWQVTRMEGKPEEALQRLEDGAKKFPESQMLMVLLADQYFSTGQVDKVKEKVAELQKLRNPRTEIIKFLQARLAMAERKWEEAVKGLTEVRPLMTQNAVSIDLYLGQLYRILGRPNDAQQMYERVRVVDPKNIMARAGLADCTYRQGKPDEAIRQMEEIKLEIGLDRFAQNVELRNLYVELMKDHIGSQPEAQQDWAPVNELIAAANKAAIARGATGGSTIAAEIQTLIAQKKYAEAKQKLEAVLKDEPKNASLWAIYFQIMADEPNGAQRTLEAVKAKSQELGQPLQLRVLEIALVSMGSDKEQVAAELQKLAVGIDKLNPAEQERLYRDLGAAFQRAGKLPEALANWRSARKVQPSDASILRTMYGAVRAAGDDAMMQEVIKEYIERFGADSEEVLAAEAARIITLVDEKKLPPEKLDEAKAKLAQLEAQNSRSGPMARLRGDIAIIEKNNPKAIELMRQAVERGERDPVMIAKLAHLLSVQGNQQEADELMARLKAAGYEEYTERFRRIELAQKGEYGPLIETLEDFLEREPNDLTKWLDLTTILREAGQDDEAEKRLREVVKRFPDDERSWVALVGFLAAEKSAPEAEAALAEAKRTVPKDKVLAVSAMCREKIGPAGQAAKEYDIWLAASPDDLRAMRTAAAFYSAQVAEDPSNAEAHRKAAMALFDKMIAKSATAEKAEQIQVAWARMMKAQTLNHRDFQEAVKLLDANRAAELEASPDRVLRATMYAARTEKVYQREGASLLQQLRQEDLLNPTGKLALAQLLDQLGEWAQARLLLLDLKEKEPNDATYPAVLIKMMIDHKEVDQTTAMLDELVKKHPQTPVTRLTQARVAIAKGKTAEGVAILKGLIPRPLPLAQSNYLLQIAKIMEEVKQIDAAEELYREYYAARPTSILIYASFRARNGRTDAALDLCDTAMSRGLAATEVVHVGNMALRSAKPPATPAQFQRVEKWIDQGLASANPSDALTLKVMRAELFDLQGKYDDVERVYRDALSQKDISDAHRALVGNNLGYLLAMRNPAGSPALDDALKMVNEAIDILGPTSDLLDTRAMVHLARKEPADAAKDLETSLAEEPSGAKFYHLALAQLDDGQKDKAEVSYKRAVDDYGFTPSDLSVLERPQFDRLKTGLGI